MKIRCKRLLIIVSAVCITGCGGTSDDAHLEKEETVTRVPDLVIEVPDEETDIQEEVQTQETSEEQQKKGILISIDPGHQAPEVDMSDTEPNAPGSSEMKRKATGGTTGAYSGIPEYELNLDISLMLRDRLEEMGYDVIMTREDNTTAISNAERAQLANDAGADAAVRIHANGSESSEANGALILVGSEENPYVGSLYAESYALGNSVLDAYCQATGMKNLGIQTNDTMTGINWSQVPVIILEMGFMTNEQDDMNMADSEYRIQMAEGIAAGIDEYFGDK